MSSGGKSIVRPHIVLFRAYKETDWLYSEMLEGRLRQGWGASGLSFLTPDGQKVCREAWNREYRNVEARKKSFGEPWKKYWPQRFLSAPWKGAVSQWVRIPPGNCRSSR